MPNVYTNTRNNSSPNSPLGNALSTRINGNDPLQRNSLTSLPKTNYNTSTNQTVGKASKQPLYSGKPGILSAPIAKASNAVSKWWNDPVSGPGRPWNPASSDYIGNMPGMNLNKKSSLAVSPSVTSDHNANLTANASAAVKPAPKTAPARVNPTATSSVPPATTPAPVTTPPPPVQPTPTTPAQSPTSNGLFGQIVGNLANIGTDKVTGNIKNISDLTKSYGDQIAGIESSGVPLAFGQGQEQVLGNQYANRLNAAQTGLSNTLTAQGQQINALGTAAGFAAPQGASPGTSYFNPLEGTFKNQFINSSGGSGGGSVDDIFRRIGNNTQGYDQGISAARSLGIPENVIQSRLQEMFPGFNQTRSNQNVASGAGRQSAYNQGLVNLNAADRIQQGILQTFGNNPALNRTPITAITNLSQFLAGQTSDPAQQQLAAQVAQYINTLNLDPSLVQSLAGQQRGTLWDLLQTLKQTAQAQNEANYNAGFGGTGSVGTGGGGNNDPLGIR